MHPLASFLYSRDVWWLVVAGCAALFVAIAVTLPESP